MNKPISNPEFSNPTAERMQKAGGDHEWGGGARDRVRLLRMRDSPLEQMLSRKAISRAEYDGGAKYRHHWYHAGMSGQIGSIDMDGVFASVPGSRSGLAGGEQAAHHRRQYRLACDHLGMIASALVESVVCREIPLYSLAADYGWNSKSKGIEAVTGQLRLALHKLCDLWSIR